MHDGDDEDVIRFDAVKHGIREDAHEAAANAGFENSPALRRSDDACNRGANLPSKALSQVASPLFVKVDGFRELQSRFRMKFVSHFASRRSIRR